MGLVPDSASLLWSRKKFLLLRGDAPREGERERRKWDKRAGSVSASSPPPPRRMSCVKTESPEQEEDSAFTNMILLPAPLSSPPHVCAHTHTHTYTRLQFVSLRTSSLFMTVLCLHQNLTHLRGCHTDLDGWMEKRGKWVNEFLFS